jgi:hypothetical protein
MVMQFGTWNVHTLLQAGNMNIITEETERYKMGIEEELQIMGVRMWRKQCEKRAEWKKITEKAKNHSGLQRQ